MLIEEDVDTQTTRLSHRASDPHAGYGTRAELRRKQRPELANFELPREIDWSMFEGLDFEAMASRPRHCFIPSQCDCNAPHVDPSLREAARRTV